MAAAAPRLRGGDTELVVLEVGAGTGALSKHLSDELLVRLAWVPALSRPFCSRISASALRVLSRGALWGVPLGGTYGGAGA